MGRVVDGNCDVLNKKKLRKKKRMVSLVKFVCSLGNSQSKECKSIIDGYDEKTSDNHL